MSAITKLFDAMSHLGIWQQVQKNRQFCFPVNCPLNMSFSPQNCTCTINLKEKKTTHQNQSLVWNKEHRQQIIKLIQSKAWFLKN